MVRKALTIELNKDQTIEVIGTATDPYVARNLIVEKRPDIILLDIEMPRMDGLTFLKKLMKYFPSRVIVVSSLAQSGSDVALASLEYGAIDVIAKPSVSYSINDMIEQLIDKIKEAYCIPMWRIEKLAKSKLLNIENKPIKTGNTVFNSMIRTTNKIIAIGASTGGTEAIESILEQLPTNAPPIVVVQHLPENFTKSFAERLDKSCSIRVKEAENNEILSPGKALIARGNHHLEVKRSGAVYYAKLSQSEKIFHQRPAVEILFNSVAKFAGKNAIGIILTGMGKDGAQGLLNMKKAGAYTIAQDEKSSIVFGMPKEAIDLGAVVKIIDINLIASEIIKNIS